MLPALRDDAVHERSTRLPARARPEVLLIGGAQLAVLVTFSTLQWDHFALTRDFALYGQAAWLIAHGHLDPVSSLNGLSFIHNNAEFLFWPLALVTVPFGGSPFVLLVLQDTAIVAAGIVALWWVGEILDAHGVAGRRRRQIWGTALVAVGLSPWAFESALFDFHAATFAAPFVLLCARAISRGERRGVLVFAVLAATTGVAGVLVAIGLGVAALLGDRRLRGVGATVFLGGAACFVTEVALGWVVEGGQQLGSASGFGYLAPGNPHPGLVALVLGAGAHLSAVGAVLASHLLAAVMFLVPLGVVGAFRRLTFAPVAAVGLPPMLAHSNLYFRSEAAFQIWPVALLVLVGSFATWCAPGRLARAVGRRADALTARRAKSPSLPFLALLFAATAGSVGLVVLWKVPSTWIGVAPAAAAVLGRVAAETPRGTEMIASQGVAGRFAERPSLYAIMAARETFPLSGRPVVFVTTPGQGMEEVAPATVAAIGRSLRHQLPGARVLAASPDVSAVLWRPPVGMASITIPLSSARGGKL